MNLQGSKLPDFHEVSPKHLLSCHAPRTHLLAFRSTSLLKHFTSCLSRNHRIIQFKGLEWTLKTIYSRPTLPWQGDTSHWIKLLEASLHLALRFGASTTSFSNLFQLLTILTVKGFSPVSYLIFPSFNLYPSLLALSLQFLMESFSSPNSPPSDTGMLI